jgi:hypothetical protein
MDMAIDNNIILLYTLLFNGRKIIKADIWSSPYGGYNYHAFYLKCSWHDHIESVFLRINDNKIHSKVKI